MQISLSYLWNKFYLHRRKIVFTFLAICSLQGFAQDKFQQETYNRFKKKQEVNLPNYDDRFLHYGFFLALNYNRPVIDRSGQFFSSDTFQAVSPSGDAGFALGFLVNVRLADQIAFKLVPAVGFYNWTLKYTNTHGSENMQTIESTFLELQFLLKYRSVRRKNTRLYLIGGFKPAIRAGGKKSGSDNQKTGITSFNFSIDYGAGLEIYFPYFKWSPELRFSHGIVNLNTPGVSVYNNALASMLTHTVTLYFFFE